MNNLKDVVEITTYETEELTMGDSLGNYLEEC